MRIVPSLDQIACSSALEMATVRLPETTDNLLGVVYYVDPLGK